MNKGLSRVIMLLSYIAKHALLRSALLSLLLDLLCSHATELQEGVERNNAASLYSNVHSSSYSWCLLKESRLIYISLYVYDIS